VENNEQIVEKKELETIVKNNQPGQIEKKPFFFGFNTFKAKIILFTLLFFILIFHNQIIDISFPRTVLVRSNDWTIPNEAQGLTNLPNTIIDGENYYITFLKKGGDQITVRVDKSFARIFDPQRKQTYGRVKSASFEADENGSKVIKLKVSGMTLNIPFIIRTYPVLHDVRI
jgi:hypothetical protein